MRARLAKAAFEIIAERGHSAFRTAAVAERAQVSQGAQVHHFASKNGLTLAAVEFAFAHASEETARLIADGPGKGEDVIDLLIRDFRLYFLSDDFWVSLGIILNGFKTPELAGGIREITQRYRTPVYQGWIAILEREGWSPANAEEMVRMTAALAAGLGIRTLWDDVQSYLDHTFARWRTMLLAAWPKP